MGDSGVQVGSPERDRHEPYRATFPQPEPRLSKPFAIMAQRADGSGTVFGAWWLGVVRGREGQLVLLPSSLDQWAQKNEHLIPPGTVRLVALDVAGCTGTLS